MVIYIATNLLSSTCNVPVEQVMRHYLIPKYCVTSNKAVSILVTALSEGINVPTFARICVKSSVMKWLNLVYH